MRLYLAAPKSYKWQRTKKEGIATHAEVKKRETELRLNWVN